VDHESPHRMPYEAHEDLDPVGAKEFGHRTRISVVAITCSGEPPQFIDGGTVALKHPAISPIQLGCFRLRQRHWSEMMDHVVDVQLDVCKAPQFVFILAITADAIGDVLSQRIELRLNDAGVRMEARHDLGVRRFAIPRVGTGLPREAYKITMPSTICIVVGPVYPDPQLVGDAMNADDVSVTSFRDRHRRDVRPDTTCVLFSQPVDLDGFSATTSTDV
jgi:hypothetical protein